MSYKKINSMKHLQSLGLNSHNTIFTRDIDEAMEIINQWKCFTIRTDIENFVDYGWKDGSQLPFFMQSTPIIPEDLIKYKIEL